MKIVQLENHVSNFDNITDAGFWNGLGEFVSYERTSAVDLIKHAADAEIILSNKTVFGEKEFAQLPKLRYIGVFATGYNTIDIPAAIKHGVTVTNVPDYSSSSVAQLVFAHMLNLFRGVETHALDDWSKSPDFFYALTPQIELDGLTLGLVGFGNIGRKTALAAHAFGMNVICFTRTPSKIDVPYVKPVDKDTLFKTSDVVSLHCPLTADNAKMINAETLSMMKKSAILINTARGGLIDEPALADALRQGKIAGAGLDVVSVEPPPPGHPLLKVPNCHITPHLAWATSAARMRLFNTARENLRAWQSAAPKNVVSR